MKKLRKTFGRIPLAAMTFNFLRVWVHSLIGIPKFVGDRLFFRNDGRFKMTWHDLYPCLSDATTSTGFDRHYTFHTAWAARVLAETRPSEHYDISSAIYFSTIVSAFIPVRFYDVRPARLDLPNLFSGQADLTKLPFESNSLPSLSCMHVVEHVGLARYGDPRDPQGDLKAIAELKRVVKPGGSLIFVVPVGAQARIQFNAHRIYTVDMVKTLFQDHFDLQRWALIPEDASDGDLLSDPSADVLGRQFYGCGCFWFRKR